MIQCPVWSDRFLKSLLNKNVDEENDQICSCYYDFENQYGAFENYNIDRKARDLALVRKALGIKQWDVYGVSYDTRIAARLVEHDGKSVRSVIYDSVDIFPGSYVEARQAAFDERLKKTLDYCPWSVGCEIGLPKLLSNLMEEADEDPFIYLTEGGDKMFIKGRHIKSIVYRLLYFDRGDEYVFSFLHFLRREKTKTITHEWLQAIFMVQYEEWKKRMGDPICCLV